MPYEGIFNRRVKEYKLDYKESHLKILCDIDCRGRALEKLIELYRQVEVQIKKDPLFQMSYTPVKAGEKSPNVVLKMAKAAEKASVGPMAAVAGAIAEELGLFILKEGAREVVVENGGDIFLKLKSEKIVGIHAGNSKWSNKLAFKVKPSETPVGICTSSATVGPSINLGEADAITVVSESAALADVAATAIGNRVKGRDGLKEAVEYGKTIRGVKGFIIIKGGELAAYGKVPELINSEFKVAR